jgi:hypothetical protein
MMMVGSGSLLYQVLGSSTSLAIGVATALAISGFIAIWFIEYERELG